LDAALQVRQHAHEVALAFAVRHLVDAELAHASIAAGKVNRGLTRQ
jgi:hypothetical protein